jgi:hypothetical protein
MWNAGAEQIPKLTFQRAGRATGPGRDLIWMRSLGSHPQQQQEQKGDGGVDRDR